MQQQQEWDLAFVPTTQKYLEDVSEHSSLEQILYHGVQKGQFLSLIQKHIAPIFLHATFIEEDDTNNKEIEVSIEDWQQQYQMLDRRIARFLEQASSVKDRTTQEWIVCLVGICFLQFFVQLNFTGPSFGQDEKPIEIPFLLSTPSVQIKNRKVMQEYAIQELSIDGERCYDLTPYAHYLLIAKYFLMRKDVRFVTTYGIWKARFCSIQRQLLPHPVITLFETATLSYQKLEKSKIEAMNDETDPFGEIRGRFYLEVGIMYHQFMDSTKAKEYFLKAQEATGLLADLTGSLGLRSKYQTEKVAMLVVLAKSRFEEQSTTSLQQNEVPLEEDSVLLPKAQLDVDKDNQTNLRTVDQAILLAVCLDIKNNNPKHGLTTEEMMPYVQRSLSHSNNWMVYTMGLLLKCRLESEASKTAERALLQLNVLADQYNDREPDAATRLKFFYCLSFPPIFELKRELGLKYMSFGAIKSALNIFEQLEMWDDVIACYANLGKNSKATELIKERLEITPNHALLWCIYGDITKDVQYYHKAWEVSKHKFARAQRSLGRIYFQQKDYQGCIDALEKALALNSMYPMTWFLLGCSCMYIAKYDQAIGAFTRVLQQEPEDAEAWSNLAICHLKLDNKINAFKALQEALKHKFNEWKMWQNYLFVCMDIGEFSQAVHAITRIIEIKKDKEFDTNAVMVMIRAMADMYRRQSNQADRLKAILNELFQFITERMSLNPDIWDLYAMYYEALNDLNMVIEMRQKNVKYLQVSGWERESSKFRTVVAGVERLMEFYQKAVDDTDDVELKKLYLGSASMVLRPIIKRTEDNFSKSEEFATLNKLLESVDSQLKPLL